MPSFSASVDAKQSGRGFGPQFMPTSVTNTTTRHLPINLGIVKTDLSWSRTTTTTYAPKK
jgi:hypothetical protein